MSTPPRRSTAILTAAALTALALSTAAVPAQAQERPDIVPLPDHLETIRAAEAAELYGGTDILPLEDRKTSLVSMGDSEISGEGVGNYEDGTHEDGNWCDRSYDQALFRTGIESDVQYNVACSGGASPHLVEGSGQQQWNELNQGDNLAVKARNTHVKLVWIVVGANDEGGIQFGPTATECVTNRILFLGPCWPDHTEDWEARVEVTQDGVETAIDAVRQTMTDAGYLGTDYDMVVMSYPSPGGPDVEDNPDFPGWYSGGCLLYLADAAFARNKAVPLFEDGIRDAALGKGVRYLNAQRLFDGHGVCEAQPWARGVYVEVGVLPSEHAFRQSLHPNYLGHGAFAQCITEFYEHPDWDTSTCVDPASTNGATLYEGLFEFKDLKNGSSGLCADAEGYDSRNGTDLVSWNCHGGRNQGFWYDEEERSLHVELSHDRCVDVEGGRMQAGTPVVLWDCNGGLNQQFQVSGDGVHPVGHADLCLGFDGTGTGKPLELTACGTAASGFTLADRDYADPAGYGYDDWIGSSVY
ncbi:ricin-type beta-trefoil lectin domain protein [Glycomyces harbinensis]|uniref:GDSL-like Lipase/Acylhydrolase family protein n=1 Tax=Glycomyces harbinensis TaxID=58114 RepID=A0A1G6QSL7_9ACTN|nr:ricin-type beta-trefoil lectin domain protein [Glycomyces harbinensis]SDC94924.1 GDSL-like Lipase/Acylhydrolase family protein [Glycomyces harbinensis]